MRKLLMVAVLASVGLTFGPARPAAAKEHSWGGHHAAAAAHAASHAGHVARATPHWGGFRGDARRDWGDRRDWGWREESERHHHRFPWPAVVFGVLSLLPHR